MFWLAFLLLGLAGYCLLRVLRLIGYCFHWVLNKGKRKEEKRKIDLKKELRELRLFSTIASSLLLLLFVFFVSIAKDKGPDIVIFAFVLSLIVSFISFWLFWGIYTVIIFIVWGFIGGKLSAAPSGKGGEQLNNRAGG
jgi:uncharacterized Tic20 family protein